MKYNYAIDTKLLPKVWMCWDTISKRYFLNGATGKKQTHAEDWMHHTIGQSLCGGWGEYSIGLNYHTTQKPKVWVKANSRVVFLYAKYHKDIEKLELAAVQYDTSRKEEPHAWKYIGDRWFIDKNKCMTNQNGLTPNYPLIVTDKQYAYDGNQVLQVLFRQHCNNQNVINEFKKLIGGDYFIIGDGKGVAVDYPWQIQKWYKSATKKINPKNKKQQIIDKLTSIPLSSTDGFAEKYPIINPTGSRWDDIENFIYFERVDDDWSVLREFTRNKDNTLAEMWRMYLSDKGETYFTTKTPDGWVSSAVPYDGWRSKHYIANKEEAIEKCKRIKYAFAANNDVKRYQEINYLLTMLRYPEVEQLAKLSPTSNFMGIATSRTPKADIKNKFGGYFNEKEKGILKKIGLNKYQFDRIMRAYSEGNHWDVRPGLFRMRELFGNNLSYIDNTSFDKYFIGCQEFYRHFYNYERFSSYIDVDKLAFFKNLTRLYAKNMNIFSITADALRTHRALRADRQPQIDWLFEDVSDAVRAHDVLVDLKRMQDQEDRARWDMEAAERLKKEEEKRIKLDKERQKYEYEDDAYIIRLPKDGAEIIREGSVQHICIGSYVSRHSIGDTNLFFLREKSNSEMPFYAIEMDRYQRIVQIHGFGNKWLGNNPEAIPTVVRWLRKHGITCSDSILTCTAKGYGSINQYVPMPIVD